jgi:flagellar basal-body rod modification protein FlgD
MNFMATISGVGANTATNTTAKTSNDQLGKDAFLNLLVTQLRNQNPLDPMDDKEFISQMAQFSSLEQMQNMNASLVATQAAGMIGYTVNWKDDQGNAVGGVVDGVKTADGKSQLIVEVDAVQYPQYLPAKAADLLNKKVSWVDDEKVVHYGIITGINNAEGGTTKISAATTDKDGKIITSTFDSKKITGLMVEQSIDVSKVSKIQK